MVLIKEKRFSTDYYKISQEGSSYQLIEGDLIMTPFLNLKHQLLSANIFEKIRGFTKNLGITLYSLINVYLYRENANQPDIVFISKDRLNIIQEKEVLP